MRLDRYSNASIMAESIDLQNVDPKLQSDIKMFVDSIFEDSQSISLEKKAEFGQLVRTPSARLLFAMCVDGYRVNSKRVSELTFYSLAQYFSIVLLECLLAEDFRPAKIIMNMMFTYYYEQRRDRHSDQTTSIDSSFDSKPSSEDDGGMVKIYLYTLLKDQEIFKSIRFWTSAFYETIVIERNKHAVFVDRGMGRMSSEKRTEELNCGKNITFGLLGSFIHNMSLLDLSYDFCREFLDKHSAIAGLTDDQLEMLRSNLKSLFDEPCASGSSTSISSSTMTKSEKLAMFIQKLSHKLNHTTSTSSPPE